MGFLAALPGIISAASGAAGLIGGIGQNQSKPGIPGGMLQDYNSLISGAEKGLPVGQQQQQQVFGQESALAQLLGQQIQGQGPNLAQTQLQQGLNQNIQNAAALGASQKGMNPMLAQRNILQATATANQQAAGQAALLRQQQQLAAQEQLQGLLGNQGNQALGQQQAQTNLIGTAGQLNNQQIGAVNQSQQTQANVGQFNAGQQAGQFGGLLGGVGSALQLGLQSQPSAPSQMSNLYQPISITPSNPQGPSLFKSDGGPIPGQAKVKGDSPKNDVIDAKLSPGEFVIPRTIMAQGEEAIIHFIRAHKSQAPKDKLADGGPAGDTWQPTQQAGMYDQQGNPLPVEEVRQMTPEEQDMTSEQRVNQAGKEQFQKEVGSKTYGQESVEALHGAEQLAERKGGLEAKMTKANVPALQANLDTATKLAAKQAELEDYHAKLGNELQQAIMSSTIEPSRLWGKADTADKLNSVVGIILGGLSQGMTHGASNQALDLAKEFIRQDVEAQKANLGKTETVFSNNLRQSQDSRLATEGARLQALNVLDATIAKNAAKSGSQAALLNSEIARNGIKQELAKTLDSMRIMNARVYMENNAFPVSYTALIDPKDRGRVVNLGNGAAALAGTPKQAEEVTGKLQAFNSLENDINEIDHLRGIASTLPATETKARITAARENAVLHMQQLQSFHRLSPESVKQFSKLFGTENISDILSGKARLDETRQSLQNEKDALLKYTLQAYKSPSNVTQRKLGR